MISPIEMDIMNGRGFAPICLGGETTGAGEGAEGGGGGVEEERIGEKRRKLERERKWRVEMEIWGLIAEMESDDRRVTKRGE